MIYKISEQWRLSVPGPKIRRSILARLSYPNQSKLLAVGGCHACVLPSSPPRATETPEAYVYYTHVSRQTHTWHISLFPRIEKGLMLVEADPIATEITEALAWNAWPRPRDGMAMRKIQLTVIGKQKPCHEWPVKFNSWRLTVQKRLSDKLKPVNWPILESWYW